MEPLWVGQILDRQTVHVHDLKAEIGTQFADSETIVEAAGTRTVLQIPLLREGNAIGAIAVRRQQVEPFSDKQIALLKTFADQAVIAMEDAPTIGGTGRAKRPADRKLGAANGDEQKRYCASSPAGRRTFRPTVVDVVAENAAKQVCDATEAAIARLDGNVIHQVAVQRDNARSPDLTRIQLKTGYASRPRHH